MELFEALVRTLLGLVDEVRSVFRVLGMVALHDWNMLVYILGLVVYGLLLYGLHQDRPQLLCMTDKLWFLVPALVYIPVQCCWQLVALGTLAAGAASVGGWLVFLVLVVIVLFVLDVLLFLATYKTREALMIQKGNEHPLNEA